MSKQISVLTTNDYLQRITNATAETSIAELIWNALDADACNVFVKKSDILGSEKITVSDDGSGIKPTLAERAFSKLGESWKKSATRTEHGRGIHGQKGVGRYKAFALGNAIDWKSTFKKSEQEFMNYEISILANNLTNVLLSKPNKSSENLTGTIVEIHDLTQKGIGTDLSKLTENLTITFANYLLTYPSVNIYVNSTKINPESEVEARECIQLNIPEIEGNHEINIIFWKQLKNKDIYICKQDGAVLDIYQSKKLKSLGFSFSAYISSPLIDELNSYADVSILEMEKESKEQILLDKAIQAINNCLKNKKYQEQLDRIERWKKEGIYPYGQEETSAIYQIEQDVFDIIATNVEDNLPKFQQIDTNTRKFTFKLLAQALKDNPIAIQKILNEVLALESKDQEVLAELLEKTTLVSIIKSAKIVADRLNFLMGLEELLFDPSNKESLLERDQLHKILESESWIFGEQYHLTGSEQGLNKVLEKHIKMLGNRSDIDTTNSVVIDRKSSGRVDLMLHKKIEVRDGEFDYLVVELKRPSQKINPDIINQIESYAVAVSEDERFETDKCNWTFIAISNEFDRMAYKKANQDGVPKGRIYAEGNVTVFIMTWAEVISNAKVRLKLYREQLNYAADDESSRKYLEQIHSKYLPDTYSS